jgi:hypothetical protein
MIKTLLTISGIFLVLGILTVAIIVAGFILGVILSVLIPVALFFTGIGLIWLIFKDFKDESTESPL